MYQMLLLNKISHKLLHLEKPAPKSLALTHFLSLILSVFLCITSVVPVFALDLPEPTAAFYVNDTADILSEENEKYIVETNEDLYKKTGAQVVVVTIKSLGGTSIEEYANELFLTYGIGDAKKNNGLLFLLALDDRECRIEVGYGLEGVINDAKAGRIMDKFMIPYFKNNEWDDGILNGFDYVLDEICQEYEIDIEHNETRVPYAKSQDEQNRETRMTWGCVIAGLIALIAGLLMGYLFPGKALIPGLIFLVIHLIIIISIFTPGYGFLAYFLSLLTYIIGWGITSPDPGGGYSGSSYSSSSSYSSHSSSSSYSSHSSSSSRNSGGGGRSGGGGASRKF